MNKETLKQSAVQAADWIVDTAQINDESSGSYGAIYTKVNVDADGRIDMGTNDCHGTLQRWSMGHCIRALSMVYELTGDKKYLDSCLRTIDYLLKQQAEDGYFLVTEGGKFVDIPDISVAVYGIIPLLKHLDTDKAEEIKKALDRLVHWLLKARMETGDFHCYYYPSLDRYSNYDHISNGIHGTLLLQYSELTDDTKYRDMARDLYKSIIAFHLTPGGAFYTSYNYSYELPVLEVWDHDNDWPDLDGEICASFSARQNKYAGTFLIDAYSVFNDPAILEAIRHHNKWVFRWQQEDGGWPEWHIYPRKPEHITPDILQSEENESNVSSTASSLIYLTSLAEIGMDCNERIDRGIAYLMERQSAESGAFVDEHDEGLASFNQALSIIALLNRLNNGKN